jgi:uncharacterized protein (DUF1501 family)
VLLRGAADGLSVVVPHGEEAYYAARPTIAIAKPGAEDGALALDEHFGLHPALAGLLPLWQEKQLAFVHAAGSPDPTRSHFDAQLFIENGTPGRRGTVDGWMNRLLASLPHASHGPTDAIAIGPTLPQIVKGRMPVANLPLGPAAATPLAIDKPEVASAFDRLYAGKDAIGQAYRQGRMARAELIAGLPAPPEPADNGAPPANGFPAVAARLAGLLAHDRKIRLAVVSLGGWDTHVRQGNHAGSWPSGCARSATGWRRSSRVSARIGRIPPSSCCPSSAAPCMKTAMPAPITITAMSSGYWVAPCRAGGSMASGRVSRRRRSTKAATSP